MNLEDGRIKKLIEYTLESFDSEVHTADEYRASLRTRFVWYVGISGYALLNAKVFWEAIRGAPIIGLTLVWLALPWIASVVLAVVAHYFTDKWATRDKAYWSLKRGLMQAFAMEVETGVGDVTQYTKLLNDEVPLTLKSQSKHAKALESWVSRIEISTFICLMLGFVWAAVGPLLLP